ncbi:MAG TPA: HAD-IC family P-type ATPase [Solirubrobacterales bacterium]|nr:HAD-IC family P-type ATPase [Solirubrobacterales bacterium]
MEAAAVTGLSESEAARRLREAGTPHEPPTSRSYASIAIANTFTVFNAILAGFGIATIIFGNPKDALFLGILVANVAIGTFQEVRAKRTLDKLAALVVAKATVVRDGAPRQVAVEEVVVGDLVRVASGDQIPADGTLVRADGLALDESDLTGESEPVVRRVGDEVLSGSFAVEGEGDFEAIAVGADSHAAKVTATARAFRHPRSPLEKAMDRLLIIMVGLMVPLAVGLGVSLALRNVSQAEAVETLTAGIVNIVPEGLILLVSLTAAVTAAKMARHGILAQQLNAVESLASVSVMCTDKTGTLTEASLRVVGLIPAAGEAEDDLAAAFGAYAAGAPTRNTTLEAIHAAGLGGRAGGAGADGRGGEGDDVDGGAEGESGGTGGERGAGEATGAASGKPTAVIPFSSRRRWSALEIGGRRLVLGAPEALLEGTAGGAADGASSGAGAAPPDQALRDRAAAEAASGRRVLALASYGAPLPEAGPEVELTAPLRPLGIVVLAEELRAEAGETIAFFAREDVALKVLSGDNPATVGAIARDLGIEASGPALDGRRLPEDDAELLAAVRAAPAIGRISPEDKARVVRVLSEGGEYVGMLGDGVNDVPALKRARLAIAQGSGTQMARSVSDLVLVSGEFGEVPPMVGEGRQILRNIQRVARLFVSKAIFTAFLVLVIAIPSGVFPMLPRQFTLTSTFTIGIPAFLLALAPSSGPWRPEGFLRAIARFSIPAGLACGLGILTTYLLARHRLTDDLTQARSATAATVVVAGLAIVFALEDQPGTRRLVVGALCAAMALLFFGACAIPIAREFFEIATPTGGMIGAWLIGSAVAIVLLAAALRVVAALDRRAGADPAVPGTSPPG